VRRAGERQERDEGERHRAKVAADVSCTFCEARLVAAGIKLAGEASEYATDYGSRDAKAELAAIEAASSKTGHGPQGQGDRLALRG
jgi:hypothetical protein